MELKGTIPWSEELQVELKDESHFVVHVVTCWILALLRPFPHSRGEITTWKILAEMRKGGLMRSGKFWIGDSCHFGFLCCCRFIITNLCSKTSPVFLGLSALGFGGQFV